MATPVLTVFPPMQGAIAQAESWTLYLNDRRDEFSSGQPDEIASSLENIVWVGVHLGELLPFIWRLTFNNLFRGKKPWSTVSESDTIRQDVRRLFFTGPREAMDRSRQMAENLQAATGRNPEGMGRLLQAIDAAHELEESVFRAWPSFTDPLPTVGVSLPVDESLAQTLGITVDEARQKLDARRRELHAKKE